MIYDLAILIFYKYGSRLFAEQIVKVGVIFLMLDPAGIAYPKLILSETLFLPFVFGSLFAIGLYLQSTNWRYLMFAGFIMGFGALIRPVIFYIPLIAAATLIVFDFYNPKRWFHAAVLLICFGIAISPWVIRNYIVFDHYFFSGQTSNMFGQYHVPRVWNSAGICPYFECGPIFSQMVAEERGLLEQQLQRPINAVEFFNLQQRIAFRELLKFPGIYFTQWISGSMKAMYVPFAVEVYGVFHPQWAEIPFIELFPDTLAAEKTDIFGLKHSTQSIMSNLLHFLIQVDKLYLFILIASVMNMLLAIIGSGYIIKQKDCFLWLMMLMNFYFMFVAGPMGYARFRMPINVFWFVQAWMGGAWLLAISSSWLKQRTGYRQDLNKAKPF